jgi:hypothetical protein
MRSRCLAMVETGAKVNRVARDLRGSTARTVCKGRPVHRAQKDRPGRRGLQVHKAYRASPELTVKVYRARSGLQDHRVVTARMARTELPLLIVSSSSATTTDR